MADISVHMFKFDPSANEAPYYADYAVPWRDSITVLEVLRYIHENFEPAGFDYSCRGASCGMCAIKVNGTPKLACATLVADGEELVLEPLDRFPVIRDLVVDKSAMKERMMRFQPGFIRDVPMETPIVMSPDSYVSTAILQQCRECMMCQSVCPAIELCGLDGYAGPFILPRIASRYFDEREGKQADRLKMAVQAGLFNCIECGTCTSVCPKGDLMRCEDWPIIDHVKYFSKMKEDARAAGLEPVPEELSLPLAEDNYITYVAETVAMNQQ